MANYSLVINSKFRPFEYQELLAPALMATQAHQAVEEAYADLSTKASIWDKMTNEVTDRKAHDIYKKYADDLQSYSDQLAQYGLTPTSRQAMLNMRSRYARDIAPIETAYKRREADIAAQKEIMLKDPTHLFNRRASEVSLDEYLDNQNLDVLSDHYSRELLTQQVSQAAANLKQTLMKKGALTALGLPYQYERMIQYGASADDVLAAISKDPKAMPILTKLVEDVMAASGIRKWSSMNGDWANNPIYQEAEAAAMRGLYSAIGKTEFKDFTDSFSMQDALARRREEREAERRKQDQLNSLAINPLNIYSSRKLKEEEIDYKNNLQKYSKYFYKDKDGRIKLNWAGLQEYRRNTTPNVSVSGSGGGTASLMNTETQIQMGDRRNKFTPTEFKKFIDSLGGGKYIGVADTKEGQTNWQPGNIGNLWANYASNNPAAKTAKYDATKVTEFDYTIAGSQQGDMKDAIMTASRGLNLKEVDYDNKSRQFKDTGEEITMEDLKNDKYKVTATRFSPYGNTVMIQDDKGNVRRFRMPAGINTTNEQNRDKAIAAAQEWQNVINTGKYVDSSGVEHTATDAEIKKAQQNYANSIQQAYLYHSQLGVQNKTKEQELQPYGY